MFSIYFDSHPPSLFINLVSSDPFKVAVFEFWYMMRIFDSHWMAFFLIQLFGDQVKVFSHDGSSERCLNNGRHFCVRCSVFRLSRHARKERIPLYFPACLQAMKCRASSVDPTSPQCLQCGGVVPRTLLLSERFVFCSHCSVFGRK